jgi:hypothetical protein
MLLYFHVANMRFNPEQQPNGDNQTPPLTSGRPGAVKVQNTKQKKEINNKKK